MKKVSNLIFLFILLAAGCSKYYVSGTIITSSNFEIDGMPIRIIADLEDSDENNNPILKRTEYEIYLPNDGDFLIRSNLPFDNIQFLPGKSWDDWRSAKEISTDTLSFPRFIVNNGNNFAFIESSGMLETIRVENAIILNPYDEVIEQIEELNLSWTPPNNNKLYYSVTMLGLDGASPVLIVTGLEQPSLRGTDIHGFNLIEDVNTSNGLILTSPSVLFFDKDLIGTFSIEIHAYTWDESTKKNN